MPPEVGHRIERVRNQSRQLHQATLLQGDIRKANKASRYVFGLPLFETVRYPG